MQAVMSSPFARTAAPVARPRFGAVNGGDDTSSGGGWGLKTTTVATATLATLASLPFTTAKRSLGVGVGAGVAAAGAVALNNRAHRQDGQALNYFA